jgi:hypothetical protein
MKRKFYYNKEIIHNTSELNSLKNNSKLLDELIISIPNVLINMDKIPQSVSILRFNYNYKNLPLDIPPNIKSLYFYEFSYLLEELPNTIEHIIINKGFNHKVDKLGNHFKSIDFGLNFNQQIDDLPSSLEQVVFHEFFTHSINNLPSNIKIIHIFNSNYDLMSIKKLPKSLILLQLKDEKEYCSEFNFTFDLEGKNYISLPIHRIYDSERNLYLRNIYFYNN